MSKIHNLLSSVSTRRSFGIVSSRGSIASCAEHEPDVDFGDLLGSNRRIPVIKEPKATPIKADKILIR
jgi:hypothetical protein